MAEKQARPEATRDYFKKHSVNQTKSRGFDGLALSSLAGGTYLGESDEKTDRLYEEALVLMGQSGVNFFDTAINYRCQRSERNIGYALRKLAGLGFDRDQFFISTKGGFLPADGDPQGFREYILKCYLNTGLITPDDIVENCHCMKPQYLQSQIDLSLSNLKIKSIDLYYLHNPEMQLSVLGETSFYNQLQDAFELFERNVQEGKISRYGLATWNGFRVPFGDPGRLDLEKVMKTAEKVGGSQHHFKAIQLPYNLAMLEASFLRNQKKGLDELPTIAAAAESGLGVFISAPLMQGHVSKLPLELYDRMSGDLSLQAKALNFVLSSPGVVSAMVGMKQKNHVLENLKVLQQDNWSIETMKDIAGLLIQAG